MFPIVLLKLFVLRNFSLRLPRWDKDSPSVLATQHRGRVRTSHPAALGSILGAPQNFQVKLFLEMLDVAKIYQWGCLELVD